MIVFPTNELFRIPCELWHDVLVRAVGLVNYLMVSDRSAKDIDRFGMTHGVLYNLLSTIGTYADIICESVKHRGDTSRVSQT